MERCSWCLDGGAMEKYHDPACWRYPILAAGEDVIYV